MNILCLNTCFNELFLEVYKDNERFVVNSDKNLKHSENILLKIDEVLEKSKLSLNDIDVFSIVQGPGSFTGIRIGMATIKAFMIGLGKTKAVQINTLDLIAFSSKLKEDKVVIVNAGGINYYVASYDKENNLINNYDCIEEKDLEKYVSSKKTVTINESNFKTNEVINISELNQIEFTKNLIKDNKFVDAENLAPFYILKSQAERNLEKKN